MMDYFKEWTQAKNRRFFVMRSIYLRQIKMQINVGFWVQNILFIFEMVYNKIF